MRKRILWPFIVCWVIYGVALIANTFNGPSALWDAVQRYTFLAILGFLTAYVDRSWSKTIVTVIAVALCIAVGVIGKDWPLAALLAGVFVVTFGIGQALRRSGQG